MDLAPVAVWTRQFEFPSMDVVRAGAAELEELGFAMVWLPESSGPDSFGLSHVVLGATERLVAGTGISSIQGRSPHVTRAAAATVNAAFPGRFVLGLGVSHGPSNQRLHGVVDDKPLTTMARYLDDLDAATYGGDEPDGPPPRVLAALGPKMVRLAGERSQGAHLYTVTAEHTRVARQALGPEPWLVPEHKVIFERDAGRAREVARKNLPIRLPNYRNSLKRVGFTDDELDRVDDRVVDALVAWGDDDAIVAQLQAHLDAGATQVAVQVLADEPTALPREGWRRLAALLPALG